MRKILLMCSLLSISAFNAQNVYNFGFDSALGPAWTLTNQSNPNTTTLWGKATYTTPLTSAIFGSGTVNNVPQGQAGGNNSFGLVNYTSTSGTGTISNWMISPVINVTDGDIVSFYTRKGTDGTTDYPDRLELRYSTAASPVNPSSGAADVGTFTNLGVSVNPSLASGFVYPKTWTKYSFMISGVGSTAVPVKFAFRYFVTNGGSSGANSDLIGIDTFSVDKPTLAVNDTNADKREIKVYPNPATDFMTITSKSKINAVEIFDASGRKINVYLNNDKIDVKNLQPGNYIIRIETKDGTTTEKFIKK